MANEIRISTIITPVNVNSPDANDDGSVESKSIDANVGRSFGGKYNTLTYNDDCIISYIGYVVKGTWTALSGNWYGEAGTSNGTAPTTAKAISVEYTKETGDAGTVDLKIDGEIVAKLDAGEGIVIPWQEGAIPALIYIQSTSYEAGVNEATVNVFLVGV